MKFENGNVKIGGSVTLGWPSNYWSNQAAIDLGGSTVHLGGDLILRYPTAWVKANWNAGTSTIICDGNGTTSGVTQTLNTWGDCGIKLHTLIINTGAGDCVTLAPANFAGAACLSSLSMTHASGLASATISRRPPGLSVVRSTTT